MELWWELYQCETEHSLWDRTSLNTGFPRTLSDTSHLKYWVTKPGAFGSSRDCNFLEAGEQSDMPVSSPSVFYAARVQLISNSFISDVFWEAAHSLLDKVNLFSLRILVCVWLYFLLPHPSTMLHLVFPETCNRFLWFCFAFLKIYIQWNSFFSVQFCECWQMHRVIQPPQQSR